MARRHRSQASPISFLSFLDIMASMIGIISLIIIILILSQVDPQAVEAAQREMAQALARAEELKKIEQVVEPLKSEQQRLKELIAQREQTAQQIAAAQQKLKEIEAQRQSMDASRKSALELQAQATEMEQKIEQLKAEQAQVTQKVEEMSKELAERQAPREEAQIKVRLSGTGENLDPYFVEAHKQGLTIYGLGPEPIQVPTGQIASGPDFKRLMETVKASPNGTIIFLIRPDAVNIYAHAANVATNNYVRNGKLPIAGQGKIDLSETSETKE